MDSTDSGYSSEAGFCEHGNEPSGSTKWEGGGNLLTNWTTISVWRRISGCYVRAKE